MLQYAARACARAARGTDAPARTYVAPPVGAGDPVQGLRQVQGRGVVDAALVDVRPKQQLGTHVPGALARVRRAAAAMARLTRPVLRVERTSTCRTRHATCWSYKRTLARLAISRTRVSGARMWRPRAAAGGHYPVPGPLCPRGRARAAPAQGAALLVACLRPPCPSARCMVRAPFMDRVPDARSMRSTDCLVSPGARAPATGTK